MSLLLLVTAAVETFQTAFIYFFTSKFHFTSKFCFFTSKFSNLDVNTVFSYKGKSESQKSLVPKCM